MPLGISPHSPQKSCSNFSTFVFLLEYKYNLNADDDAMLSKKFHQLLLETKKDCFRFHSQKLSEHQKLDLPSKKARFLRQQKEQTYNNSCELRCMLVFTGAADLPVWAMGMYPFVGERTRQIPFWN